MSGHDAASVEDRRAVLPPAGLIERFALAPTEASDGSPEGTRTWRGFCGFDGRSGFDDGYAFMADLLDRGWRPLPAKGDWPYLVYVTWVEVLGPDLKTYAIAEYCEGDLVVWLFPSRDAAKTYYASLRDCP
jgi:hypothetical protein